jgi:hypothetical protein
MTEVGTRDVPPLNWDVLITPGIPIATSDLPPGMKHLQWGILRQGYGAVREHVETSNRSHFRHMPGRWI